MSDMRVDRLDDYYETAQSWSDDRELRIERSRRIAWIVAGIFAVIALTEAIALGTGRGNQVRRWIHVRLVRSAQAP